VPKPNPDIYPLMLESFGIGAQTSAFFEDMARNLTPAHKLGMATVLVQEEGQDGAQKMNMPEKYRTHDEAHIDHTTTDLARFLTAITAR
jgi:putative hydrolase of the HAD superfamily